MKYKIDVYGYVCDARGPGSTGGCRRVLEITSRDRHETLRYGRVMGRGDADKVARRQHGWRLSPERCHEHATPDGLAQAQARIGLTQ